MPHKVINVSMYSDLYDLDIAVSLISFNRPDYLESTISSLEKCVDKEKVDWVLLQDGAVNKFSGKRRADDEIIEKCKQILLDANLPNKDVRVNDENMCSAIQFDKQWQLFNEGYDVVIRTEADIVLSKYIIRVMLSLLDQFPDNVCSGYVEGSIKENNIDDQINKVEICDTASFCTSAMMKDTFKKLEHDWDRFRNIAYANDWWVGSRPRRKVLNLFNDIDGQIAVAYDGVMGSCIRTNGIKRVETVISRGSHIGKNGMNVSESTYNNTDRWGDEGKLEYANDENPSEWEVVDN